MMQVRRSLGSIMRAQGGVLAMVQTLLAQGLTMAVNIATGVITARLLGPEGRGEFAAASLWLLLPSLLAVAGLQNAVVFLMRQRPAEGGHVAATALVVSTGAFVPMLLVCLWLLPWLMHAYPAWVVQLARVALLLSVANVWMGIARQWLLGLRRFNAYNTMAYASALGYLALLLVMIPFGAVTPATATLAQIGATIAVLLVVLPTLLAAWWRGRRQAAPCLPGLLRYGLKAAPIDLITTLSQNIDRLILVALVSARDFGIYVVAMSFARILSVLQTAVAAVMLADLANSSPARVDLALHRCFRVLLWALVMLFGLLCLVDAKLLALVYGPAFAAAAPIFRVLLFDAALTCLTQVQIQGFLAVGMPGLPSTIQIAAFGATALGIALLTPSFGAIGAAVSLALGSCVRLACLWLALPRAGLSRPGLLPRLDDVHPLIRRLSGADGQ